ncbi:MAG TPA: hypothetical protein VGN57_21585 [Pirellulaceae bacterium]|nr:hypothetical protein [Pirellulaceae bacterium]
MIRHDRTGYEVPSAKAARLFDLSGDDFGLLDIEKKPGAFHPVRAGEDEPGRRVRVG